jgi:catechol 2,3-dioxygenase-like lactoylglutathione lyase family enzyme
MSTTEITARAELLHETSIRHGAFEAVTPPHDWWDWYAAYMDARDGGSAPDDASAAADRYMAEVKDVVANGSPAPAREGVAYGLEVVIIPVSDVDRAKAFYTGLGWREDADFADDQGFRIVQLNPPGSGASIQFGARITTAPPGSAQGNYLVVDDIQAARADLIGRGAEVSEVFHEGAVGDRFHPDARVSGPAPERATYGSFVAFSDPDGNSWLVQEITTRLPGRVED